MKHRINHLVKPTVYNQRPVVRDVIIYVIMAKV